MDNVDHINPRNRNHFVECKACGQYMDRRDKDLVLHHETGACVTGEPAQKHDKGTGTPISKAEYDRLSGEWKKKRKPKGST